MDVLFLIGRILFALIFVNSGLGHFKKDSVEYARSQNAPAPELLVPASGVAIVLGGLFVALGLWADVGALLIIAFLVGITPVMHVFWKIEDSQMRQVQMSMFMKNVALIGAALVVFYVYNQLQGEAPLSLTDPLFGRAD